MSEWLAARCDDGVITSTNIKASEEEALILVVINVALVPEELTNDIHHILYVR